MSTTAGKTVFFSLKRLGPGLLQSGYGVAHTRVLVVVALFWYRSLLSLIPAPTERERSGRSSLSAHPNPNTQEYPG